MSEKVEKVAKKACECKGKRTCLICEIINQLEPKNLGAELKTLDSYTYCMTCCKIVKGWDSITECDKSHEKGLPFPGVFIKLDFISESEAKDLIEGVDLKVGWDDSQSGRRKKNYGPKTNFKKKKLSLGKFQGFPEFTKFLKNRLNEVPLLSDFIAIEECYLEYEENRGAHIDLHIDDCWIWGERILTVNCLGDSVLTFTKHVPLHDKQYNIDLISEYESSLIGKLETIPDNVVIRIPMPVKSLMVLYGPPRYQYEHCVLREDIDSRRVCIAYREFTKPYLPDGIKYSEAEPIFKLCHSIV